MPDSWLDGGTTRSETHACSQAVPSAEGVEQRSESLPLRVRRGRALARAQVQGPTSRHESPLHDQLAA